MADVVGTWQRVGSRIRRRAGDCLGDLGAADAGCRHPSPLARRYTLLCAVVTIGSLSIAKTVSTCTPSSCSIPASHLPMPLNSDAWRSTCAGPLSVWRMTVCYGGGGGGGHKTGGRGRNKPGVRRRSEHHVVASCVKLDIRAGAARRLDDQLYAKITLHPADCKSCSFSVPGRTDLTRSCPYLEFKFNGTDHTVEAVVAHNPPFLLDDTLRRFTERQITGISSQSRTAANSVVAHTATDLDELAEHLRRCKERHGHGDAATKPFARELIDVCAPAAARRAAADNLGADPTELKAGAQFRSCTIANMVRAFACSKRLLTEVDAEQLITKKAIGASRGMPIAAWKGGDPQGGGVLEQMRLAQGRAQQITMLQEPPRACKHCGTPFYRQWRLVAAHRVLAHTPFSTCSGHPNKDKVRELLAESFSRAARQDMLDAIGQLDALGLAYPDAEEPTVRRLLAAVQRGGKNGLQVLTEQLSIYDMSNQSTASRGYMGLSMQSIGLLQDTAVNRGLALRIMLPTLTTSGEPASVFLAMPIGQLLMAKLVLGGYADRGLPPHHPSAQRIVHELIWSCVCRSMRSAPVGTGNSNLCSSLLNKVRMYANRRQPPHIARTGAQWHDELSRSGSCLLRGRCHQRVQVLLVGMAAVRAEGRVRKRAVRGHQNATGDRRAPRSAHKRPPLTAPNKVQHVVYTSRPGPTTTDAVPPVQPLPPPLLQHHHEDYHHAHSAVQLQSTLNASIGGGNASCVQPDDTSSAGSGRALPAALSRVVKAVALAYLVSVQVYRVYGTRTGLEGAKSEKGLTAQGEDRTRDLPIMRRTRHRLRHPSC
ncbi:hypothetical protein JKP88DRAFT_243050 [Tribonema minus]|uniref:Uncharacterized protein n=1 Tax=Tribonema minus TaxID=303371 RepID=A0A836CM57_9STRA|nr:hypothetical protein JKP88DRAFT_243050 [Tribonema minus]